MANGSPARHRPARIVAAAIAALALGLLVVLPALAANPTGGPSSGHGGSTPSAWTKLDDPSVTPLEAATGSPITFAVTYRNPRAVSPAYVRVDVDGVAHAMSGAGTDWKAGVRFSVTLTLSDGSHHVIFRALDTERFVDVRDFGTITVGVAAPSASDPVTPTSSWAADLPASMEVPAPELDVAIRHAAAGSPPAPVTVAGPGPAVAWSLSGDPILAALGVGHGRLPLLPSVIGSVSAVGTWMAFLLFGKRRRDAGAPAPDAVLEAAAAQGLAIVASSALAPADPEALMPRWRRPSLIEARKTDPVRAPAPPQPKLAFGDASGVESRGLERRLIRYAVAPLLDAPDELRGGRMGDLIAGDEVALVERMGAYWLVDCPDGRRGWVHRTTLGDRVGVPDEAFDADPLGATETFSAGRAIAARLATVERP